MDSKNTCRSALLMFVLLFLSAGVATARDNATRARLVAEVTRLGGKVEFDETRVDKPIVKVDLHGTQVTDEDLAVLKNSRSELKELRYLDLRLTKIGDEGVAKLANLKSLQTLNLFRTQLSDAGLAYLKKLTGLETLLIGGTKVSDAGLISLRPFKKLKKLSLFQTQVSDGGIAQLKLMTSLEVLLISGSKITPAGAEELQKAMPKVRFNENT
jgi:Leucine-rich repeat (LRR) protein